MLVRLQKKNPQNMHNLQIEQTLRYIQPEMLPR